MIVAALAALGMWAAWSPAAAQQRDTGTQGGSANTTQGDTRRDPIPQPRPTDEKPAKTARDDHKVMTDSDFLMKAAAGNQAEIELGRIASRRAASIPVRRLGQRLADDHARANERLLEICHEKNLQVPQRLDAAHRKMIDKFSELTGQAFDRQFVKDQIADHQKDIKMYKMMARDAKDPMVRSYAEKTLPNLREHLKMAQALATAPRGTGTGQPTGPTEAAPGPRRGEPDR
jgi:putative membrane protein